MAHSGVGAATAAVWLRPDTRVGEVMQRDIVTAMPGDKIGDLVEVMAERSIDRLPVVDEQDSGLLVGMISSTDVIALDQVGASWAKKREGSVRAMGRP